MRPKRRVGVVASIRLSREEAELIMSAAEFYGEESFLEFMKQAALDASAYPRWKIAEVA